MFPSLSLHGIIGIWRDRLKGDAALKDFCLTHYGAAPKIVVGCKAAAAADCPVIVLRPGSKIEGAGKYHNIYKVFVDWAVVNSAETATETDGVTVAEQSGLAEIDALGQIIIAALGEASPAHPVTRLEYRVDGTWFPMLTGKMMLKTHIAPVLGTEMSY